MNQDKNTIKVIIAVLVSVVLGEGILGWGIFWPVLFLLVDWVGVYWLALVVGLLISVFEGIGVGWPSLVMVAVLGVMQVVFGMKKGDIGWLMVLAVVANLVFDWIFGLKWNLLEMFAVIVTAAAVVGWEGKAESISVRYK